MSNPYLDIDWAIALQDPDMSHLLWLSDKELNVRKETKVKQNGRNITKITGRSDRDQKAA